MNAQFVLTSPEPAKTVRPRRGGWSWGPVEGAKLRVLSNGGGIQSSTLICMMIERKLPWVDKILFADTGDDSKKTMAHVDWLETQVALATNGQVECIRVSQGEKLSDSIRRRAAGNGTATRFVAAPFFTANGGQGRRQCTREFKVEPLTKKQRELLGFKPRQRVPDASIEVWIGFSTDEVVRAGAAFERWAVHRFPLLEARMSRQDCETWLTRHGYPVPPKSACVFCPYRTNAEWRWMRDNDPDAWAVACEIDALVRNTPGMRNQEFLHRSLRPLDEVDLSTPEERGQGMLMVCDAGCGL